MDTQEEFERASKEVLTLKSRPDNTTLLELYALYKQATEGDVSGARPGMLDLKGRKKYDAWAALKGTDAQAAMEKYIALVTRLKT